MSGTAGLGSNGKQVVEICLCQHKPVVSLAVKNTGNNTQGERERAIFFKSPSLKKLNFVSFRHTGLLPLTRWSVSLPTTVWNPYLSYSPPCTPTELVEVGVIVITTMLYTSIKGSGLLGCIIHSKRVLVCCVMKQGIIYRAVEEKLGPSRNAARGARWNEITFSFLFFFFLFLVAFISRIALMGMSVKERKRLPRLHERHHDGAM